MGLAERAIDRLEGQRGVLRQDLRIVAGGLCGEVDLGAIAGVQIGNEDGRDRNGKENAECGDGAFRAARQFARNSLAQPFQAVCETPRESR